MNKPVFVLAVTIAAILPATAQDRYGLEKAKANMSTFKTAEGLTASLVAAEPDIQNPTNIEVDHRGRVWATECVNYRRWMEQRADGDRVVILEDTNGDGLADKSKTFYQSKDLTNPLGICVLPQAKGTKVIVSAAPNVWLLTDKDGDDVAEEAVVLFKIGGVWNYDHQIHAFVFGADGKFYFNSGNSITDLMWPDGKRVKDILGNDITNKGEPYRQGMVFRCDIDLATGKASNVETLGHNFRNNYEVAVDSFGGMWQSDNDDDGNKGVRINFVMDHGNYGYTDEKTGAGWQSKRTNLETEIPLRHWHLNDPGVVPNLLQTGAGSPTGILVNEGAALGAAFTNQLIHCDAGPRTVRAYPVEKDGAGYKATMVDILTSSDQWYRPSDVAIAPDGSLIVGDWYDSGVGGHNMGDNTKDKMMGRIYRVAAAGAKPAAEPDFSTADGAAKALTSPNKPTQYAAWAALNAMGEKAEPALLALWKNENPRIRSRALGLLAAIKGKAIPHLSAGLIDADSDVRCEAIRLCRMMHDTRGLDTTPLDSDPALVGKLLRDPSAAVRREIALSLHRSHKIEKLWAALAAQHDGKDRWFLEALGIGSVGNEDICFDTWLAMVGEKWNTPGGRDIIWRTRAAKAATYLAKLIQETSSAEPRYMRAFDFLPASEPRTAALIEIATAGKAGDNMAREALTRLKGANNDAVAKAIAGAMDKAKGTVGFIELAREFGVKGRGAELLATAVKLGNDPAAGEAIKLVLTGDDWEKVITDALAGADASAVAAALAASGSGRATARLASLITSADQKPELRKTAVAALVRTQQGADAVLKLAKEGKFPEDMKLAAASAFAGVQYAALSKDIAAHFPMPSAQGGKPLPAIAELAKLTGDAAKGRAVFERTESTCITCHAVGGKGVDVGPGLSEIGSKLAKDALFESILNPNSGISMGFETQLFTLKDGGGASGILRSETNEEIMLVLPGGAAQKVSKNNIAKREKLTTSMMPVGLSNILSQQDLVDLVEYLASLKKK